MCVTRNVSTPSDPTTKIFKECRSMTKSVYLKTISYQILAKPKETKGGIASNPVERFVASDCDFIAPGCT